MSRIAAFTKIAFITALFIGFFVSAGGAFWFYAKYQKSQEEISRLKTEQGQAELIEQETTALLEAVRKLIIIPENEEPVVATIVNSAKLSETQPFYKGAQDGDKLIIFPESEKALIYSPSRNILVSVGPAFVEKENDQAATKEAGESKEEGISPVDDSVKPSDVVAE